MLLAKLYNRDESEFRHRDPKYKATDQAALSAIAQAAIERRAVHHPALHDAPLFDPGHAPDQLRRRTTSIPGGSGRGRRRTAEPETPTRRRSTSSSRSSSRRCCTCSSPPTWRASIGATPVFTSPALQDRVPRLDLLRPDLTVIPHIIDLKDTRRLRRSDGECRAARLATRCDLFLAIEQPEDEAKRRHQARQGSATISPKVPFADWTAGRADCRCSAPSAGCTSATTII